MFTISCTNPIPVLKRSSHIFQLEKSAMASEKGFSLLPREMAVKIFGLLSIEELKACVQVRQFVIRVSVSELNISCCRCVDLGGISEAVQIFGRISCTSFCLSKNKTSFPKTSCYRFHISESRLEKMSTIFQTPR